MYFQQERMTGSLRPPSTLVLSFPLHEDCEPCGYVHLHTHAHETYWCNQASPRTFHTASQNEPKLGSLALFFKIKDARSSELFTATCASWEALQRIAQRFPELCQPPPRDKAVIHEGGTIKVLTMRPNEKESVFLKTELAIVHYCLQAKYTPEHTIIIRQPFSQWRLAARSRDATMRMPQHAADGHSRHVTLTDDAVNEEQGQKAKCSLDTGLYGNSHGNLMDA